MSINAVYEDSQGNVHESRMDGVDLTTKISIADDFSASVNYAVGDFCYHLGTLYKCTTAHTAGAWDAAHFTATQVGNEIGELKNTLNHQATGTTAAELTTALSALTPAQKACCSIAINGNDNILRQSQDFEYFTSIVVSSAGVREYRYHVGQSKFYEFLWSTSSTSQEIPVTSWTLYYQGTPIS